MVLKISSWTNDEADNKYLTDNGRWVLKNWDIMIV